MTMSVPRIWEFDRRDPEMRAALNAGWRRHELWWERLQERANVDLADGKHRSACRRFRMAYWVACIGFERADPRFAASLANLAIVARKGGQPERAARLYVAASETWERVAETLSSAEISPRVRSSLFHLRMEQRHRALFESRNRALLATRVAETGTVLTALAQNPDDAIALLPRWKAEKPRVFDDTRRILAACLLVATSAGL